MFSLIDIIITAELYYFILWSEDNSNLNIIGDNVLIVPYQIYI